MDASKNGFSRLRKYLVFLLLFGFVLSESSGQLQYDEGDWVSYADFQHVTDIAVGRDEVYFATTGGVLRYHRYKHYWKEPWVIVRGRTESVDLRGATNVDYLPETDEVAVQTIKGYAYLYNPVTKYWKSFDHQFTPPELVDVADVAFIKRPDWAPSRRAYFPQGNNTVMDSNLKKYSLTAYADDGWGTWWIAVIGAGILQLDIQTKRATIWELGLYGRDVRAFARGGGWTIIAGHNRTGGITFWKRKKNLWDHLEREYTAGLESTWINDLAVSGRWALAATDYGLAQINLKNGICRTWTIYDGLWSERTTCVAVDKDTAWVGTDLGVCRLLLPKGPVKRLENRDLMNQPCYRIAVDGEAVWIGGELGLYRLDRKTGRGGYLANEGGVAGPVYALHSRKNEIWVGRMTGIEVINKRNLTSIGYPSQAFFGGDQVNAIMAQDSLVWIGTNRGLWKFDRDRDRWFRYDQIDGLLDNRIYAIYPDGDYLLLGTIAGITRFFWNDPERID